MNFETLHRREAEEEAVLRHDDGMLMGSENRGRIKGVVRLLCYAEAGY